MFASTSDTDESRLFVGLSQGYSLAQDTPLVESQNNSGAHSYGILLGYRFNNWIGLDANLINLGGVAGKNEKIAETALNVGSVSTKIYYPLNSQYTLSAKVGAGHASFHLNYDEPLRLSDHELVISDFWEGNAYLIGIGGQYRINKKWSLDLSLDSIHSKVSTSTLTETGKLTEHIRLTNLSLSINRYALFDVAAEQRILAILVGGGLGIFAGSSLLPRITGCTSNSEDPTCLASYILGSVIGGASGAYLGLKIVSKPKEKKIQLSYNF